MRAFFLAVVVIVGIGIIGVGGCATTDQHRDCPPLPTIGENELLKDYTLKVVQMYNTCREQK